jgi:GNAT superfamily N-acetyltransferase
METARPAREDDLPACLELLTLALANARSVRGGPALAGDVTPAELLARWTHTTTAASPEDATLYVGEFHQAVVGLAAATVTVRPHASERSGRIECCYVEEEARGVGVGTALMDSMVAWCSQRGCRSVDALALPGDRLTKQRFEGAGFTARLLVLNRPLN